MESQIFRERERRYTLMALVIAFALSALDETVIVTAVPKIIIDLQGLSLYSWVTTAYLLTSTVTMPLWGKLSDIYGRRPVFLASILFFLVGSCLSGLSGEFGTIGGWHGMVQLIVFRAIQGIGAGGLFTIPFIIVRDIYPPGQGAKIAGIFGAVFTLATIAGPLVGGFLTEYGTINWSGHVIAGWRFVFYINLPFCLVCLFIVLFRMPKVPQQADERVDVLGAILIAAAVVPLMLALTWGGHGHAWTSPLILALLGGAAVALGAYILAERFAPHPVLPLELFRDRLFSTANLGGFLIAMSFIGTIAFLPLFVQVVQGANAAAGGFTMMPLLLAIMGSAIASGLLAAKTGHFKAILLGGALLTSFAIWLLSRMTLETSNVDLIARTVLLGIGLGPCQSLFTVALQNGARPNQMGVVTSSSQFFRQIGATLGIALSGGILAAELRTGAAKSAPGVDVDRLVAMSPGDAAVQLPELVRGAVAVAVTNTFTAGLVLLAGGCVAILLMPPVILRKTATMDEREPAIAS